MLSPSISHDSIKKEEDLKRPLVRLPAVGRLYCKTALSLTGRRFFGGGNTGSIDGGMDGWREGWMDGWRDGWIDGWMDEWMDGLMIPLRENLAIIRYKHC